MPPNYQKSKIYCIRSPNTEQVYIGSTVQTLSQRMAKHRKQSNTSNSKIIVEAGNAYIELIEEFSCNNKEQLHKREGEIIRNTKNCINLRIPGRTSKEHYEENKEKFYNKSKQYYQENKDKILEKKRDYWRAKKSKEHSEQVIDDSLIQGAQKNT